MKNKKSPVLYIVWALTAPGPKWRPVSEPKPRSELVLIVRDQWSQRNMARIRPAPVSPKQHEALAKT